MAKGPASRRAQNRRQARDSQALTSLVLGNFERDALSKGLDKRKAARCRGRALHDLPHRPSKYSTSACCFSGATNFYRPASSTRTLWIHLRCQAARLKARKGGKPGDFCPATKQTSRSQGRRQSPPPLQLQLDGISQSEPQRAAARQWPEGNTSAPPPGDANFLAKARTCQTRSQQSF